MVQRKFALFVSMQYSLMQRNFTLKTSVISNLIKSVVGNLE